MAIFIKPDPYVAHTLWSLWLAVALATLVANVIYGIIFGLTFGAMAIILALGTVVWLVVSLWYLAGERRARARLIAPDDSALMDDEDTLRLNHE